MCLYYNQFYGCGHAILVLAEHCQIGQLRQNTCGQKEVITVANVITEKRSEKCPHCIKPRRGTV